MKKAWLRTGYFPQPGPFFESFGRVLDSTPSQMRRGMQCSPPPHLIMEANITGTNNLNAAPPSLEQCERILAGTQFAETPELALV